VAVFLGSSIMVIDRRGVVVALVGGVLLGFLDFVWIKFVPFPFGGLGNSVAVWAVAAFLLAWRSRSGVAGSVVLLVVAVPSYYLAAAVIQHDEVANVVRPFALVWMVLGVVAGVVFGAGGVVARRPGRWRNVAAALPGAVLFAEAAVEVARIGDPSYGVGDQVGMAVLLVVLGLVVTVLVGGVWARRGVVLLWCVPVAAVGWALMAAGSGVGSASGL
jgi:hypothetical protein